MKIPKAVLGAFLVGVAVQTTACSKKDAPTPKEEQAAKAQKGEVKPPYDCPACGMG